MCLGAYLPTFCEDIARPTCFSCGCMGEQNRFCQHLPFPNGLLGTSDDVVGEAATGFYGTKNGSMPAAVENQGPISDRVKRWPHKHASLHPYSS